MIKCIYVFKKAHLLLSKRKHLLIDKVIAKAKLVDDVL